MGIRDGRPLHDCHGDTAVNNYIKEGRGYHWRKGTDSLVNHEWLFRSIWRALLQWSPTAYLRCVVQSEVILSSHRIPLKPIIYLSFKRCNHLTGWGIMEDLSYDYLYVALTSNLRPLPDAVGSRKLNRKQMRSCKACVI